MRPEMINPDNIKELFDATTTKGANFSTRLEAAIASGILDQLELEQLLALTTRLSDYHDHQKQWVVALNREA